MKVKLKLREVMDRKGITGIELSRMTGIPEGRISDYNRGRYIPSTITVCILAQALGCEISELIEYDGEV